MSVSDIQIKAGNDFKSIFPIIPSQGGTGLIASPLAITNLESNESSNIFVENPSIGVTGILPISNGGTGLSASPSALTNLSSTDEGKLLTTNPSIGVTGTLSINNGGTGATTSAAARTNLGLGTSATTNYITSVTQNSSSLVTSGAIYSAINSSNPIMSVKGYMTNSASMVNSWSSGSWYHLINWSTQASYNNSNIMSLGSDSGIILYKTGIYLCFGTFAFKQVGGHKIATKIDLAYAGKALYTDVGTSLYDDSTDWFSWNNISSCNKIPDSYTDEYTIHTMPVLFIYKEKPTLKSTTTSVNPSLSMSWYNFTSGTPYVNYCQLTVIRLGDI
jgi:hypothetical protein